MGVTTRPVGPAAVVQQTQGHPAFESTHQALAPTWAWWKRLTVTRIEDE
jgi:hypothetical protein